jgi:hypothetical protein
MDKLEILEQIFDQNFAVLHVELIKDKLFADIRSLSVEDYFEIDKAMTGFKGTELKLTQQFAIEKLSRSLMSYKDTKFENAEQAREFLTKSQLSASLIDKLLKAQHKFEKDVKEALEVDSVEEAFFVPGDSQEKQEQSPVASISDEPKA